VENPVKGFFAPLTRRRLKLGAFGSVGELTQVINRFIAETKRRSKALRRDR
jgi:hypothetical protein